MLLHIHKLLILFDPPPYMLIDTKLKNDSEPTKQPDEVIWTCQKVNPNLCFTYKPGLP